MTIFIGLFKKEFIEFKRYSFNTVIGLLSTLLLFFAIFKGFKIYGNGEGDLSTMITGYLLLVYFLLSYQSISTMIISNCEKGTIEQFYMSSTPFLIILLIYSLVSSVFNLILTSLLILPVMFVTNIWLNIDIFSLIPILIISSAAFIGIGLILGGMTLRHKNVTSMSAVVQFAIFGFISLPLDLNPLVRFLPGTLGKKIVNDIMLLNLSLNQISLNEIVLLIFSGVFYLLIGILIFRMYEKKTKHLGIVGHY